MRVLFVCIGNSCRSQMAEGFARALGKGIWGAESAGLMPASIVQPLTRQVMEEKQVSLEDHFPKGLYEMKLGDYDMVVNMSGFELPVKVAAPVRTWNVQDPIGQPVKFYREVRDEIEGLVRDLLDEAQKENPQ